jgi:hypothetical protein
VKPRLSIEIIFLKQKAIAFALVRLLPFASDGPQAKAWRRSFLLAMDFQGSWLKG